MTEHDWAKRGEWSVCIRCGMVRNYQTTPCRGTLPRIGLRDEAAGEVETDRDRCRLALGLVLSDPQFLSLEQDTARAVINALGLTKP